MKTQNLVVNALFAGIMCVVSVITIPIGTVPVTLSLFGVVLAAATLGAKNSAVAVCVYILLGALGLPVFSGFGGGLSVLFGPTGGFVLSYVPVCFIIGSAAHKSGKQLYLRSFFALVVSYLMGTVQFMFVQSVSFVSALMVCVVPFVVFDVIKIVAAISTGKSISKIIRLNTLS